MRQPAVEPGHLGIADQRVTRHAQFSAEIEQIVLNVEKHGAHVRRQVFTQQHPEVRIGLVDLADGDDTRAELVHARAVPEAGLAAVARARDDLAQTIPHLLLSTPCGIACPPARNPAAGATCLHRLKCAAQAPDGHFSGDSDGAHWRQVRMI
ncbi:MAG: hypothetical protein BGP02_15445 [Pandoraea sp. 64-18]|nr:MAG: hypothetical protein BGP02_15445 [Pandoraea sp. 64-18]